MQVEKFVHDGKQFEIRVITDGESVYVKVFKDGRPANRFRYSATIELVQDMNQITAIDAVKHLIEIAKRDVQDGLK